MACLPDRLKAEIAIHVHLDTLKRVDIFQNTEAGFLCELVLRLKPVLFSPGDYVCRKNEVGHEMYIVSRGILEVVTNEGKTVVATLKAGSYFGEISVLNVGLAGNKRTASVRSVGYSDLFCLNKQDLWDVLKNYPNAEARIRARAEERLSKLEVNSANKDSSSNRNDKNGGGDKRSLCKGISNRRDVNDDEDDNDDDRPRRRLYNPNFHYYAPSRSLYLRKGNPHNVMSGQYISRGRHLLDSAQDQYYNSENRSQRSHSRWLDRDLDLMSERDYPSREFQKQIVTQHQPTCRHSRVARLRDPKFRSSFHDSPPINRLSSRNNINSNLDVDYQAARRPKTLLPPQTYVSYSRSFDGRSRESKLMGAGAMSGSSRVNEKSLDTDDYALESPSELL